MPRRASKSPGKSDVPAFRHTDIWSTRKNYTGNTNRGARTHWNLHQPISTCLSALLTQLVILTGKSCALEGWKRASVPRFSSAPTAGCSPASLKGHFSRLLPTLRRQQIGSSVPSAPNSRCKVHFNLADPLAASAASSEFHSGASKSPHPISVSQVKRATCLGQPSGSPAQHTVFALHIIFSKPGSLCLSNPDH